MAEAEGRDGAAGAPGEEEGKRGYFIRSRFFAAPAISPGLYIVATPIGNLGDITIRALDILAGADLVACEDTRVTRKLLTRYGIETQVLSYHEHSGERSHQRLLERLGEGKSVALVSDAGTPLISDPGYQLVVDAAAAGHPVVPIPGASSLVAALSAAGLPAEAVLYAGFLPSKAIARRKRLAELADVPATLVLFESPNRIAALLADAAAELGTERPAAICRELTKLHETFDRGILGELAARYAGASVKGEVVLAIAPPCVRQAPTHDQAETALRAALGTMGVKEAARFVADSTGLPRRELYQKALTLKGDS